MTVVNVTISSDTGNFEVLVMNTREDLLHDFQFFHGMAKANSPEDPKERFLHQRFLRAALLTLFAYAEAVVNGWVYSLLESRNFESLFKRLQWDCLEKKIDFLNEASTAEVARPKVNEAKSVRNLFVHFTPGKDADAFDKLTLSVVENAAEDLERWMTEMELKLGFMRHPCSEDLMIGFSEIGEKINEATTDPTA